MISNVKNKTLPKSACWATARSGESFVGLVQILAVDLYLGSKFCCRPFSNIKQRNVKQQISSEIQTQSALCYATKMNELCLPPSPTVTCCE